MKYNDTQIKEYMKLAIEAAKESEKSLDVPIGAVLVKDGIVIAKACNRKELLGDASMHAEMIVIQEASRKLGNWYLEGCDIFVTLEPCLMCFGAMLNARIDSVYYGAKDERFGTFTANRIDKDYVYNHKLNIVGGILESECSKLLSEFFKQQRKDKIKKLSIYYCYSHSKCNFGIKTLASNSVQSFFRNFSNNSEKIK